jgi:hypothetical protein
MLRIIVLSAAVAISVSVSTASAGATSKSFGEITAASRLLAEKQESCRIEAKKQKLRFLKRRSFMRMCMRSKP